MYSPYSELLKLVNVDSRHWINRGRKAAGLPVIEEEQNLVNIAIKDLKAGCCVRLPEQSA